MHRLIVGALSYLSPASNTLLETLIACRGHSRDATTFARNARYENRYVLYRQLKHDGLPPIRDLAAWIKVLLWLQDAEAGRTSLFRLALDGDDQPETCYRLVHRITGLTWVQAKREGFDLMLARFLDHCRERRSALREHHAMSA